MNRRTLRNAGMYGAIGALSAAQAWPEDSPLTWRFWVGVALGALVAMKALYSKGAEPLEAATRDEEGLDEEGLKVKAE